MSKTIAECPAVQRRSRCVLPVRALILVIVVLMVTGYRFVVVPVQRFSWIVNAVDTNGGSSARLVRVNGGPDWLRGMVGDEWMYGFDETTVLWMRVHEPFETGRLLTCLRPQASLRDLRLDSTDICDDEFGQLAGLPGLQRLKLSGGILSDQGLKHLRNCGALEELRLSGMDITDDGVARLAMLPSLEVLEITGCPGVTDASVSHIRSLTGLQELSLSRVAISDTSVDALSEMKTLRTLRLMESRVTEEAVIRLHEALPDCAIYWNDSLYSNRPPAVLF